MYPDNPVMTINIHQHHYRFWKNFHMRADITISADMYGTVRIVVYELKYIHSKMKNEEP